MNHMNGQENSSNDAGAISFYQRLCESAALPMVAADDEYNIISANSAAAELLGREPSKLIGRELSEIVPAGRRQGFTRLLNRTIRRGLQTQFDIRTTGPDARAQDLRFILSPVQDSQGQMLGVGVWIIQQTSSRNLSERLLKAEKMASLGTLAGGIAHHFNNIIGGVATFVDFALSSGDDHSMRRALEMTAEAAARVSDITDSLLSFAVHGRQRADLADLTEVVLTFVHLSERPLADRNIHVKLDMQPVPIIEVESARTHQVLANLLANAEEAMPNGGTISVGLSSTKTKVVMTFADSGKGITPDRLAKIFEPFYTTKGLHAGGNQKNPGLGLSVVHGIIEEMGGTISVESSPDSGSTFTLEFPIPTSRQAARPAS